jgi:hypothetical protein
MIRTSCHTADNALALEFDATPWFREADPQSILHLAEQDWSSVWVADALKARPGYKSLHHLIDYAATRLIHSLRVRRYPLSPACRYLLIAGTGQRLRGPEV